MFGIKKLKRRIASLEQFLNIRYSPSETDDFVDEHLSDGYGRASDMDKTIQAWRDKKEADKMKELEKLK